MKKKAVCSFVFYFYSFLFLTNNVCQGEMQLDSISCPSIQTEEDGSYAWSNIFIQDETLDEYPDVIPDEEPIVIEDEF